MKCRLFGQTGLKISPFALGTWNFGEPTPKAHLEDALPVMDMALDPETAAKMDKLVPPGTAVADFHNTSGWIKMKI